MTRKQPKRSGKPHHPNVAYVPDSELDLSDIPEMTEDEMKRARRVGSSGAERRTKVIAIWVATRVLERLRWQAVKHKKPFPKYISEIVERAVNRGRA